MPFKFGALEQYLPEFRLTNDLLVEAIEKTGGTSDADKIEELTGGMLEGRIARQDETVVTMGVEAARKAMDAYGLKPEDVDMLGVALNFAPNGVPFPSVANLIAAEVGIDTYVQDYYSGCSGGVTTLNGVVNELERPKPRVKEQKDKIGLVVATEALSKIVNVKDRSTCILFGDGANAAVIDYTEEGGISPAYVMSTADTGFKGDSEKNLPPTQSVLSMNEEPVDGMRMNVDSGKIELFPSHQQYIYMAGNPVFKYAGKAMVDATLAVLEQEGLSVSDLDYLIPHSANGRITDTSEGRLRRKGFEGFVVRSHERFRNTSVTSALIALYEALHSDLPETEKLRIEEVTAAVTMFGAGLTKASYIVRQRFNF